MPFALPCCSRMKQLTHCSLLLFAMVFAPRYVFAQRQMLLNPASHSNLWLASLNPAAMSFHTSRAVVGTEILHAGFVPERALGLNEQRLHLALPYWLPRDFAFGLDLRSFNAMLYSEIEANLLFSKKILSRLALGMKLGLESRGFERSQFTQVDPNDPLLQGADRRRSTPNIGAGLYWNTGAFYAGASVSRLYRPNLAYASTALLPRLVMLGFAYDLGWFTPSLAWNHDGTQSLFGFELTTNVNKLAALRLSYERSGPIRLETQFHFHRNAKLAYGVNLPAGAIGAASSGTHALVYEHVLGREPEIGAPLLVLSTNHMNIMITRERKIVEADVPLAELAVSPSLAAEYVDPQMQLGNLVVVPLVGIALQTPSERTRETYRRLSQNAAFLLQENELHEVAVRIAPGAKEEARVFESLLRQEMHGKKLRVLLGYQKANEQVSLEEFRAGKTTFVEHAPIVSHERLAINLVVPSKRRHVEQWKLDIHAPNGVAIKSFEGMDTLPLSLEWNWRYVGGELANAGQYRCVLLIKSKTGKKYAAASNFEITRTQREVTLRLSRQPKASERQSTATFMSR